jgi:hypothetical protein
MPADKTQKPERLGDGPIQEKYRREMNVLAGVLDEAFNGVTKGTDRKTGFILMVFPFNDEGHTDGRCNYISNGADRNEVVVLMKEMIARFEGQPELKGNA